MRLLARALDPRKFRIDVVACFRKPGMPEQAHRQLEALGVDVDTAPYQLSFEDTVDDLAGKLVSYDVIVSCQNVADIYPALERLDGGRRSSSVAAWCRKRSPAQAFHQPLCGRLPIDPGCRSLKHAWRETHAVEIPPVVDLWQFGRNRSSRHEPPSAFPTVRFWSAGLQFGTP